MRGAVVFSCAAKLCGGLVAEKRGMLACVLTDVQFWVPVVVLVAGVILLEMIR
jgi:hypothetical protein